MMDEPNMPQATLYFVAVKGDDIFIVLAGPTTNYYDAMEARRSFVGVYPSDQLHLYTAILPLREYGT